MKQTPLPHLNTATCLDLSFIKGTDFANSCTWKVLEDYTDSDHNYILIEALFSQSHYSYPRFKTAYGGYRRMLQHLRQKSKQLVQQIEESNTKDHLANATEELQKAIFVACRKAYRMKKFKLKINNWLNQNLQMIKKKELQALKRRTNKSEKDNKRKYQLQFSKKQAELKRATKKKKRNSFWNTCTKLSSTNR
ncbi:hypothetical protein AVEN_146793-1 [Araneus ventricosus]|uniref:Endonuclease/exonuclease/phosphatase domain-containing protein n=1 Tax=Araneus ventricosus TaxID=182803 RepID=A0A4Y2DAN0_ARAVE|nr:hypothetical protein AVEN_146793-1 [Araneus ventricosus]